MSETVEKTEETIVKEAIDKIEEAKAKEPEIISTNEEFSPTIGQLALAMSKAQGAMANGKKSKDVTVTSTWN